MAGHQDDVVVIQVAEVVRALALDVALGDAFYIIADAFPFCHDRITS